MKLILCKKCQDVVRLVEEQTRHCKCGECGGYYFDEINAVYWGEYASPLGFDNSSLVYAINNQPQEGMGERFDAFVIPKQCPTFKKVKPPEEPK